LPADCRHSFHTTNTDLNKPTVKLQNSNTHHRMQSGTKSDAARACFTPTPAPVSFPPQPFLQPDRP
jgi:hypothetical protein